MRCEEDSYAFDKEFCIEKYTDTLIVKIADNLIIAA